VASVNSLLKPISTTGTVRDYKHASRTFVDNNFELQPKHSNLFHVVFEFTSEAATLFSTIDKLEIPLLVKTIDLPQYTIDVQTHNQYNRKVQSHHGMTYQPINATFHDDAKELIRTLWHNYYTFYNADATYDQNGNSYTAYDKYSNRIQQQWGFQRGNKRFFKNIKIYSMHNHKFAEYTLINPMITAFNHDQHAYANTGLMQHSVQFAYETVKYATGYVNNITPTGFGDLHYDVERSDIEASDSKNAAFINGSLSNVTNQETKDLFQGNLIGVIKDTEIIFDQRKPPTTGNIITDTISIFTNNLLTGQKPSNNILVPFIGAGEQLLTQFSNTAIDGVVNTVQGFLEPNAIVKSQNKNISTTRYNTVTSSSQDIGFANNIPVQTGTISNGNKISNVSTTSKVTQTSKTKEIKIQQLEARLSSPSIPDAEKQYIQNQLFLLRKS